MKLDFRTFLLTASCLLNLVLLRFLAGPQPPPAGRVPQDQPVAAVPVAASAPPRFQWSQLESAEYPAYIANLRGIGCPERTVREIVAADLDDLFAPRRGPFVAKLTGPNATAVERNQAEGALARLRQDEEAMLRKLFGIPAADNQNPRSVAQAAPAPLPQRVRSHPPAVEDLSVTTPMALQSLESRLPNLGEDEIQAINRVRESFTAALGTDLDVNSREYLHRWQTSQEQADDLLGALLGRQTVLEYEQALGNQPASTGSNPAGK